MRHADVQAICDTCGVVGKLYSSWFRLTQFNTTNSIIEQRHEYYCSKTCAQTIFKKRWIVPTNIKFECPTCRLVINGRNFRRHMRKEHRLEVPDHVIETARSLVEIDGIVRATW